MIITSIHVVVRTFPSDTVGNQGDYYKYSCGCSYEVQNNTFQFHALESNCVSLVPIPAKRINLAH